jgi:hypothetical protein
MVETIMIQYTTIESLARETAFFKFSFLCLLAICAAYVIYSVWKSPERQRWIQDGIIDVIPTAKRIVKAYCPYGYWKYYAIYTSFFLLSFMFLYISTLWIGSVSYAAGQHNSICMYYGAYDPATMDAKLQFMIWVASFAIGAFGTFITSQLLIDATYAIFETWMIFRDDLSSISNKVGQGIPGAVLAVILLLVAIPFLFFSYFFLLSLLQPLLQI